MSETICLRSSSRSFNAFKDNAQKQLNHTGGQCVEKMMPTIEMLNANNRALMMELQQCLAERSALQSWVDAKLDNTRPSSRKPTFADRAKIIIYDLLQPEDGYCHSPAAFYRALLAEQMKPRDRETSSLRPE